MRTFSHRFGRLLRGGLLTPRGWVVRAAMILVVFVVLHGMGWRVDTKIISGTSPPKDVASKLAAGRGVIYGLAYFGSVVLAPIYRLPRASPNLLERLAGV